jgi:hypothetical protein
MATSTGGSSASKRPFYSDAGRRFVDALESCIAAKFTGARNVDCPLPRASVNALVSRLFHAPYSTWFKGAPSKDKSRWGISWDIAGRPSSCRISGPHWKDIDELATVLGFESLADAGNPSGGSPVSLIALVPALLLLSTATEPVEKFVAEHAFQVLDSFTHGGILPLGKEEEERNG